MKKTVNNGRTELWASGYVVSNNDQWIYDEYGVEAFCPADIANALAEAGTAPVTVLVDSPGGSLIAGAAIYTALMSYGGQVTLDIRSIAASAASAFCMAAAKEGNRCRISPMAMMMIHNVQGYAAGDYRDMERESEHLKTANSTIINAYRLKTGLEDAKIQELLDAESWFTAREALELKLVDEILFDSDGTLSELDNKTGLLLKNQAKTLLNAVPHLSQEVLERMRAEREQKKQPQNQQPDTASQLLQAQALLELEKVRF